MSRENLLATINQTPPAKIEEKKLEIHEKAVVDVKGYGKERAFVEFRGKKKM